MAILPPKVEIDFTDELITPKGGLEHALSRWKAFYENLKAQIEAEENCWKRNRLRVELRRASREMKALGAIRSFRGRSLRGRSLPGARFWKYLPHSSALHPLSGNFRCFKD